MNEKPIIENSDRGITLNKQLAWTIGGRITAYACGSIGCYFVSDEPKECCWKLWTSLRIKTKPI